MGSCFILFIALEFLPPRPLLFRRSGGRPRESNQRRAPSSPDDRDGGLAATVTVRASQSAAAQIADQCRTGGQSAHASEGARFDQRGLAPSRREPHKIPADSKGGNWLRFAKTTLCAGRTLGASPVGRRQLNWQANTLSAYSALRSRGGVPPNACSPGNFETKPIFFINNINDRGRRAAPRRGRCRCAQTRLGILGWLNGQDRRSRSIFFLRSASSESPTVQRAPRSQDIGIKARQRRRKNGSPLKTRSDQQTIPADLVDAAAVAVRTVSGQFAATAQSHSVRGVREPRYRGWQDA